MTKTIDDFTGDTRVDGAVQDGYRYLVKFRDGTKEYCRDHDDLASVVARHDEALEKTKTLGDVRFNFSGARALEGQMVFDDGQPSSDVIGEVRGKGSYFASDIRGITYTRFDEDRFSDAAYEAAAAESETNSRVQEDFLVKAQEVQRKMLEGAGVGQGGSEDPNVKLMG